MLLGAKKAIQTTHYEILSVKEDASYDEIRASYRAAILHSHPDKLREKIGPMDGLQQELQERFLKIRKAWEILSNCASRAVYDRELNLIRQDSGMPDEVLLEEMVVEENGEVLELFHQCRCGDYFSINSYELGEMGFVLSADKGRIVLQGAVVEPASIIIPCGSCSLKILLSATSDL